jgi:hypothetical protein
MTEELAVTMRLILNKDLNLKKVCTKMVPRIPHAKQKNEEERHVQRPFSKTAGRS